MPLDNDGMYEQWKGWSQRTQKAQQGTSQFGRAGCSLQANMLFQTLQETVSISLNLCVSNILAWSIGSMCSANSPGHEAACMRVIVPSRWCQLRQFAEWRAQPATLHRRGGFRRLFFSAKKEERKKADSISLWVTFPLGADGVLSRLLETGHRSCLEPPAGQTPPSSRGSKLMCAVSKRASLYCLHYYSTVCGRRRLQVKPFQYLLQCGANRAGSKALKTTPSCTGPIICGFHRPGKLQPGAVIWSGWLLVSSAAPLVWRREEEPGCRCSPSKWLSSGWQCWSE